MALDKLKAETFTLFGGINTKASPYDNAPTEFRDISNMNFVTTGALTKRPGTALYGGATVQGVIGGLIEFERLNGNSYLVAAANTNIYSVTQSSFTAFRSGLLNNGIFDFTVYVDRLFACNGNDYFKFDGSKSSFYSLPPGITGWGVTSAIGGGLSGTYNVSYGYINDRGYIGPIGNKLQISLNGITFGTIVYLGLTALSGYGITAIQLYRSNPGFLDTFGTTTTSAGSTTASDTGFALTTNLNNFNLWFTLAPKYLEIYNNQLFMAGFSSLQSTVYWSQIAEPEGVDPTFFAEIRSNDGDRITGLKFYYGQLIITKERSTHRVIGDNPSNFAIQQISDQYGCISRRTMVTYESLLWFLDRKGIVEYNGANLYVVSNKIEPIFQNMNLAAARNNAVGLHNRQGNEVWFAIPTNGATMNNTIIVYDYISQAWTHYDGLNVSALTLAQGALTGQKVPFYGSYSGSIAYFGSTLTSDNGAGFTCSFATKFITAMGQTTEQQFRRFFINLEPITTGITQAITVQMQTNYGTSTQLTQTMYQNPFQSRIDFGLSAKSIQATVSHFSATNSFKCYAYTFESRYQRST